MAAVTINQTAPVQAPYRHIVGDLAMKVFNISGASGSTLDTKMINILFVDNQNSNAAASPGATVITSYAVSGSVITFTSSGTMVNEVIIVFGREG